MRVARDFQHPEVAHRLETVREDALRAFLETAPSDPVVRPFDLTYVKV